MANFALRLAGLRRIRQCCSRVESVRGDRGDKECLLFLLSADGKAELGGCRVAAEMGDFRQTIKERIEGGERKEPFAVIRPKHSLLGPPLKLRPSSHSGRRTGMMTSL